MTDEQCNQQNFDTVVDICTCMHSGYFATIDYLLLDYVLHLLYSV